MRFKIRLQEMILNETVYNIETLKSYIPSYKNNGPAFYMNSNLKVNGKEVVFNTPFEFFKFLYSQKLYAPKTFPEPLQKLFESKVKDIKARMDYKGGNYEIEELLKRVMEAMFEVDPKFKEFMTYFGSGITTEDSILAQKKFPKEYKSFHNNNDLFKQLYQWKKSGLLK